MAAHNPLTESRSETLDLSLGLCGRSPVYPAGTCAYEYTGCTSPWERDGSARYCWQTSTNGVSGIRPP